MVHETTDDPRSDKNHGAPGNCGHAEQAGGSKEGVAAAPKGGVAAATPGPFRTALEIAQAISAGILWIARPWIPAGAIVEIVGKVKTAGKTTFISYLIA